MKIVEKSKLFMGISAAIILVGIIVIVTMGLNLGIDFSGGSIITYDMGGEYQVSDLERILSDNGVFDAPVQQSGAGEVKNFAVVRIKPLESEEADVDLRDTLLAEIQAIYPDASVETVDRVGSEAVMALVKDALLALGIAGVLIFIYISIRFEFYSAISAILCLLHDVFIMLAFVAITRMEVNSTFIAGVLTIVGYSINNTIVVFDRIRDNQRAGYKEDMAQLVNESIKQTFTRSMYTSLTTLVTIVLLYVLGADSIKNFAMPIIVGLLAGTYSSLVIAGPMWTLLLGKRKPKAKKAS